jgi:hypothetical protein
MTESAATNGKDIAYALPFLPLVTRLLLCTLWHWLVNDVLKEEAQERDLQRAVILALAGFSFTAAAGLAVLDASKQLQLQLPIWYALLSFVCYFTALNAPAYKVRRWQGQLALALIEAGSLSLLLTLASLIVDGAFSTTFKIAAVSLTCGPWLADHLFRLGIDFKYFSELDNKVRKTGTPL